MSRTILAALCALTLAGCEASSDFYQTAGQISHAAGGDFLLLDTVSLINTGKTIDDHVIGWATGQDCSVLRASHGESYCQAIPLPPALVPVITYCYKSLASVSCYAQPMLADQTRYVGSRVDMVAATP
jgi:hypothetical protein